MTSAARVSEESVTGRLGPATVVSVRGEGGVTVAVDGAEPVEAVVAVAGGYRPRAGDRVLVAEGEGATRYVLGVLSALREAPTTRVGTRDGVTASVEGEVLQVHDRSGRLLFEHRADEGRTVLCVAEGDLELRVSEGNLDLVAARSVRVRAEQGVELEGARTVRLGTAQTEHRAASEVKLDALGMHLAAPLLDARATRAELSLGEATLVARTVHTAMETARHVVGVVETRATRLVERVKDAYREVEGLSQLRAGRARFVAEGSFHLLGRRTILKAEEDLKLKGEKIHLA